MNDTSSFGSFTHSFISSFRDELLKMPCLVFPLLSDAVPRHIGDGNVSRSFSKLPLADLVGTRLLEPGKRSTTRCTSEV